ncbi:GTP-binding protein [Salisediminibacterium beveridgei]|uniref:Putative metal chaperone, involved in Zn homeostasis, GTPase of COG0523 family n=1 Tax=Salisediminibacterium beveridgei TaxID=632773 RepID=A0A1D7QY51_9BACI|nr:GTP-binding protein [Salisediminibacterium beveridgei]AOM83935.1 Putative metal chaperone, involved in Zn homeostasis, GTPase of COG0523 family [Salisediminibacterium beveridgei]
MTEQRIPVTVLSGYLGAGKTSLLNHLLSETNIQNTAVIVNDMSEINIDALDVKNRTVHRTDDQLIEMSNGCICCTLREDLLQEVQQIAEQGGIDYILIESSGISEPVPVAQTFTLIDEEMGIDLSALCQLDTMVTVVDCQRFWHDYGSGESLAERGQEADENDIRDISDLLADQIEFCDVLVLNKADAISKEALHSMKAVMKRLQPEAKIIETNYGRISPEEVLHTGSFDYEKASLSAGWLKELEAEEHTPETEEYGISSFVYRRTRPFHSERFMAWGEAIPEAVIRSKGIAWCATRNDVALLYSQAGPSASLDPVSFWVASTSAENIQEYLAEEPGARDEWDDEFGDRKTELVFIGQNIDREALEAELDECLLTDEEMAGDWGRFTDPFPWET